MEELNVAPVEEIMQEDIEESTDAAIANEDGAPVAEELSA